MDMWTLYWLTRFEAIKGWLPGTGWWVFVTVMVGICVFISYMVASEVGGNEHTSKAEAQDIASNACTKFWFGKGILLYITVCLLILVSSMVNILLPTNKELAIILGGYYATNNEEFVAMPSKAAKVVNKFMDEYLVEDGAAE